MTTTTPLQHHVSGSTREPTYLAVVIGAGFGGIGMGCQLRRKLDLQPEQFLIVERQSNVGGTWWINKYPGVQCDIPACFYSLSFYQNPDWTKFYPSGSEIYDYANSVVEEFGLRESLALNTEAIQCQWDAKSEEWTVLLRELQPHRGDLSTADRAQIIAKEGHSAVYKRDRKVRCKALISAVGGLVEPAPFPANVEGLESFQGDIVHSARWREDIQVRDKDVIVVGTGCSAAQIVPQLLKDQYGARSVTQLMREPPWVVPQPEPPSGHKNWETWVPFLNKHAPGFMSLLRTLVASEIDQGFKIFEVGTTGALRRQNLQRVLEDYIKRAAPKEYQAMLTPSYPVGCKRRIYDTEWFQSMHDDRFTLTTLALREVQESHIILRSGTKTHHSEKHFDEVRKPADLIILANGFAVHDWFHPLQIIGREGKTMHEVFDERGGPQLYKGTALDGFPNMFILFGPNSFTGHSSVIAGLENHINHAIKLLRPLFQGDAHVLEVKRQPTMEYNQTIQKDLKNMVWNSGGCSNWYQDGEGRNSVSWPYSMSHHTKMLRNPSWSHWNIGFTRQGLMKARLVSILKAFVVIGGLAVWSSSRGQWIQKTLASRLLMIYEASLVWFCKAWGSTLSLTADQ